MTKTDKKREADICRVLTHVCENALEKVEGFEWLTHEVNYKNFPSSLQIVCVFSTKEQSHQAWQSNIKRDFVAQIERALSGINIELKDAVRHIRFDSEEECESEHQGNWQRRIKAKH